MYTEFPCLKISPLHNFQKRDFLCILAHTFSIGLFLLMEEEHVKYTITQINEIKKSLVTFQVFTLITTKNGW